MTNPAKYAWGFFNRLFEPLPKADQGTGKETLFAYPGGFTLGFSFGQWVWPRRKSWRELFSPHPWTDKDARVFRSKIPLPGVFLSYKHPSKGWGFYAGLKDYDISGASPRCVWASPQEHGNRYLVFSVSIRRTADK